MEEEKKEPFDSKSVIINKVERGNFFKYTTIALLVVLIAGLAYVVYGDKFSFGEDIAAKVNGEKITLSELNEIYDSLPEQQKSVMSKEDVLDQLVQLKVIYQEAKKEGLSVTEEEASEGLNLLLVSAGMTREQFLQGLSQQGVREEDFIKKYIEHIKKE